VNMRTKMSLALTAAVVFLALVVPESQADSLEERVTALERQVDDMARSGLVLFLYGAFCALWAQRTKRSAWLWFFVGLFFGPIALVVLLVKNSRDS